MRDRIRRGGPGGAVALLILIIATVLAAPWSDEPDSPPQLPSAVERVDGPDADRKPDDQLSPTDEAEAAEVYEGAQDRSNSARDDLGQRLRECLPGQATTPAKPCTPVGGGLTPAQEAASQRNAKRTTTGSDTPLPRPAPLAAQSVPGCKTAFVRNRSSRQGRRPAVIYLHYTVSQNRPGWGDVDGLTAYSNNPRSGVSWHFNIDREAHCAYTVPLEDKAWTQLNANGHGIGIEATGTGREVDYLDGAGFTRLQGVVRHVAKLYGIPLQQAVVRNCVVIRAGITDHRALGPCGGGHHDIGPYNTGAIVDRLTAPAVPLAPAKVRSWCGGVKRYRDQATALRKRGEHPGAGATHLAQRRKALAAKYGYKCGTRDGRSVAVKG